MSCKQGFFLLFFLISTAIVAQYREVDKHLKIGNFSAVEQLLNDDELSNSDKNIIKGKFFIKQNKIDSAFHNLLNIDTLGLNTKQKAFYYNYLADAYDQSTEYDLVVQNLEIAQRYFEEIDYEDEWNEVNMQLYLTLLTSPFYEGNPIDYLHTFHENAKKNKNYSQLTRAEINLAFENITQENPYGFREYMDRAFEYSTKSDYKTDEALVHNYLGLLYGESLKKLDSAEYHYQKAREIYNEIGKNSNQKTLYLLSSNLARYSGDVETSIQLLKKADATKTNSYQTELEVRIYHQLAEDYKTLGQIDSAYAYMEKYNKLRDQYDIDKQNVNLARFQAERKEKENLLLEQKNQRNRIIIFIGTLIIIFLLILGYFVVKNIKRKQLLLEKQKEIEKQRNARLRKEQELKSIDAMLEGQEKERQRIASDLHDNIGASLTSVKMHFNHLKSQLKNQQVDQDLIEKTNSLLEETYQEIRNLSHLKNAGVLAKDGLIPALEKLVKNTSKINGLELSLHTHKVDDRLSSKQEITIFRIIQELITNIMKHAQAKEANISLTNYNDVLNIMIEDDGVGFDSNQLFNSSDGMGLESIKKRVNLLKGEFEIDSKEGRGTTVIIDIPL
ncbi:MAG: ATP-binding protein [Bacteroidota bacterium]